jgi:hypothetical protein
MKKTNVKSTCQAVISVRANSPIQEPDIRDARPRIGPLDTSIHVPG